MSLKYDILVRDVLAQDLLVTSRLRFSFNLLILLYDSPA